jgi:hypothetical protein
MFKNFTLFIFFIYIVTLTYGSEIKETYNQNKYHLSLIFKNSYSINSDNTVNFTETIKDYSKPGSFNLPQKKILIKVPGSNIPIVAIQIIKSDELNGTPSITPDIKKENDSTLIEANANFDSRYFTPNFSNFYKINGIKNIKGQLYLDIDLFTAYYDFNKRKTISISELSISLEFDNNISAETTKLLTDSLFLNQTYNNSKNFSTFSDTTDNWIDYSKTYLKLGVVKDGIYRITPNDLEQYGINTSLINPKSFKLFSKGKQIPIFVHGENDNQFDNEDYIEFIGLRNYSDTDYRQPAVYNEPYNEFLNRYSDTTAYFLTWDGDDGIRMEDNLLYQNSPNDTLKYYDRFLHFEQNPWFDFALSGGNIRREDPEWYENETWIWWTQGVTTRNQNFTCTNLFPNKPAKVYAKLMAYASNVTTNAHLVALKINSYPTAYDSSYLDKYQVKTYSGQFNSNLLNNGSNTLKIVSYPTLNTINTLMGDWVEIEYPSYLKAINDTLTFGYRNLESPIFTNIEITNFNTNNFAFYKFNSQSKYIRFSNINKINSIITFVDSVKNGDLYFLSDVNLIKKPIFYYKKNFLNLRNTNLQAEHVIIYHPKFAELIDDYKNFISSNYNLNSIAVNINDIYDEFNYGFFAPEPIKSFLKYATYNWNSPKIKYVLLVGRANYDYKGYKTKYQGAPVEPCFIPSFGIPVSDYWFTIFDSTKTYIPEISIGRIPARSLSEFSHYFYKHQNYVNSPFNNWNKSYLFFSGGNFSDPNQINTLKGINDDIINFYVIPNPVGGYYTHFYKTVNPITNFGPYSPSFIQEKIDNGSLVISYLGHSGTQTWDNSITDPIQLRNLVNRSPLITDFGCSTARFAEPDITSFSELFVNGLSGQAIGYIGNSSLGFTSTSYTAPKIFYSKLLSYSDISIGEAHVLTKLNMLNTYGATGTYRLFSLTNTLVGDPIIKLALPSKINLSINSEDFYIKNFISDSEDSILVKFQFRNLGKVQNDSFNIKVNHFYNNSVIKSFAFKKIVPKLIDSLFLYLNVKNLAGNHSLEIILDPENSIDELYEDDNSLSFNFNVYSTSIRNIFTSNILNTASSPLTFINPILKSSNEQICVQYSNNFNFIGADSLTIPFGNLITKINIPNSIGRIWFKSSIKGLNNFSPPISLVLGSSDRYSINDSISFSTVALNSLFYKNSLKLDSILTNIYALSAGYNAGRTAIIALNGQNLIPENTLRGFHVVRIKSSDLSYIEYRYFDISPGGAAVTNFINYLNTIPVDEIVVFSTSDDVAVGLNNDLKNKLKEFGSKFSSQIGFRYSWALIGYKGAPIGSVPEGLKAPFDGKVEIDTTISRMPLSGSFVTTELGPVAKWKDFEVDQSIPEGASIKYTILGVTDSNSVDTLDTVMLNENGVGDIGNIDATKYPKIKVKSNFNIQPGVESPSLRSLSIGYDKLPELATNYQVVTSSADSINQGGSITFNFGFMNVGGGSADSFKVLANIILPNKTKRVIFDSLFTTLDTMQLNTYTYTYVSNFDDGFGDMAFELIIDSTNKVKELFKDNNYFNIPFYVIKDTVTNIRSAQISVKFDGLDIADGDFVSNKPEITFDLNYMPLFPYNDTTAFRFYLDGVRRYRNEIDSSVYDTVNRKITFYFKPILSDGEHFIRITGNNLIGNLEGYAGYQKNFVVSSEAKVLYVYNYPNPFTESTYFTFKLSQIPDEMYINIYTVAGRLIKKLKIDSSELNIDFNKIFWDGKDEDGDEIGNGVYFYKLIMKSNGKTETVTQKFAKIK